MTEIRPNNFKNAKKWFEKQLKVKNIRMTERKIAVELNDWDWWLLFERSFMASCSSCWSSGCYRIPAVKLDSADYETSGMCDTFEDLADALDDRLEEFLKNALNKCTQRNEKQIISSAGSFIVVNIDLFNVFESGYKVDINSLKRLEIFHNMASNHSLNQAGYQVISQNNDNIIMIAENGEYLQYLSDSLKDLNKEVGGITVGMASGEIYYLTPTNIISEAINKNWLNMRKPLKSGDIILDQSVLSATAYFPKPNLND
jgi:hypothetical protein